MVDNITREDLDRLVAFLSQDPPPRLTQASNVIAFEKAWAQWVGVKHCVFVNSGASANLITMAALKYKVGVGEVIVPSLTWSSDIVSVVQAGMQPVFVDINPRTLSMDTDLILAAITDKTKAVFMTHAQGFNGLTQKLLDELEKRNILLIEDVCESHGATFKGKKCGAIGFASNFSFYFAHHMSTIEGGMVCTNDDQFYSDIRLFRSHGMTRESPYEQIKQDYIDAEPELNPEFIFWFPGYNVRNTEIGGVLGLSGLPKLDGNNKKRYDNFAYFLSKLSPDRFQTDFALEGSINYAFNVILKDKNDPMFDRICEALRAANVEFRRGSAGGGNMLRQPFVRPYVEDGSYWEYPVTEHIHFYGFYVGNYPELTKEKIDQLCELLNNA